MNELESLLNKFESVDEKAPHEQFKPDILVIDDDESIRRGLKRAFAHKYNVTTAESGTKGAERLHTDCHCVILDVKMQDMDGFETYPELKKKCPDVPVLFFTAFQSEHDLQEIINRFKPEGYVEKGQNISFLEHLVEKATKKYQLIQKNEAYKKSLAQKVEELNRAYIQLEQQAQKLKDLNLALNVLIEKKDQKRLALEQSIQKNIEENILPDIEKLKTGRLTQRQNELLDTIESSLLDITSKFLLNLSIKTVGFTPSEMKIANYIRQGKSSKEIADYLTISTETVKNHRIKIRKKLGLVGKPVNLYSHLSSLE